MVGGGRTIAEGRGEGSYGDEAVENFWKRLFSSLANGASSHARLVVGHEMARIIVARLLRLLA